MSTTITDEDGDRTTQSTEPDAEESIDAAELAVLREENDRLREQFRQARRSTYRRTTIAFVAIGGFAIVGGIVFPDVRTLLIALGGTGIFAGLLTWFVTPEQFHAATVTEHLQRTQADNAVRLIAALGLQDIQLYVPSGERDVWLYIPAHREYTVPPSEALDSILVVTDDDVERGLALKPVGTALYEDFETATTPADDPATVATQLADAVVEQFELARAVEVTVEDGAARFEIVGSSCGRVAAVDQPAVSLLAVGLAIQTDEPVRIERAEDGGSVRCVWDG